MCKMDDVGIEIMCIWMDGVIGECGRIPLYISRNVYPFCTGPGSGWNKGVELICRWHHELV